MVIVTETQGAGRCVGARNLGVAQQVVNLWESQIESLENE